MPLSKTTLAVAGAASTLTVALIVFLVWWFALRSKLVKVDLTKPPAGYLVENSTALAANLKAGQKWPTTNPCDSGYFLITPSCKVGTVPGLINGGAGKCTDSKQSWWSGCEQAAS